MTSSRQSGFDIGGAINSAGEWLSNAPIIHRIVNNPVYTALLITALVATVAIAMYREHLRGKKAVRALIYVFFLTTLVVFVHHYAILHAASDNSYQKYSRDVFEGVQSSRAMGGLNDTTPVIPAGEHAAVGGASVPPPGNQRFPSAVAPPRAGRNVAPFGNAPGDSGGFAIDDAEIPFALAAH
jgi:multisubunit Na+/H+ antiporter MnhC subunit